MYEVDFLPVGDAGDSGDAICMRFTRPDTGQDAVVVIDAGYRDDGEALAAHIPKYYGTQNVDLAILTHPDGDHINGMGEVIRELDVSELWLHDIGAHGGTGLPATNAVNDLTRVAKERGTVVSEPWPGEQRLGGAITLLGPAEGYYDQLVQEQVQVSLEESKASFGLPSIGASALVKSLVNRIADSLPSEVPFGPGDVNPRNNSSMVTLLTVDGKTMVFTADAGVPALEQAWDHADALGLANPPDFVQMPHHGSRRNCSSAWMDRFLGPAGQPAESRTAFVSCVADSKKKHPSGRVWNAHMRRGCKNAATAGSSIRYQSIDAPARIGWGPIASIGPMEEEADD